MTAQPSDSEALPQSLHKLVLDYGDACFRCGEYSGEDTARYAELSAYRLAAFNRLARAAEGQAMEAELTPRPELDGGGAHAPADMEVAAP